MDGLIMDKEPNESAAAKENVPREAGTQPVQNEDIPQGNAPVYYASPAPAPYFASESERRVFKTAGILSFIPAYLYVRMLLGDYREAWFPACVFAFTLLFVAGVEGFAYALGLSYDILKKRRAGAADALILGISVLAQGAVLAFWVEPLLEVTTPMFLMWHVSAVLYVVVRCDVLTEGRPGPWIVWDLVRGFFYYPFVNFLLRARSVYSRPLQTQDPGQKAEQKKKTARTVRTVLGSAAAALILILIVWNELAEVSDSFAAIAPDLGSWLRSLFGEDIREWLLIHLALILPLSIPVGAYLFGLTGGSLRETLRRTALPDVQARLRKTRRLPELSAWIVLGLLIAVYALFFGVALSEFIAHGTRFTAHEASVFAVKGFWQLIRIILLNIALLAAFSLFGQPLWEKKSTRVLVTLLFVCALAFAGLAAVKLYGVYIGMFGLTARRLISGWALSVLIVLCGLLLVRFFRKIPAVRIALLYAMISYMAVIAAAQWLLPHAVDKLPLA